MAKYWDTRIELFGSDKAFLPFTLDGAFQDDESSIKRGCFQIIPALDPEGRGIILFNSSQPGWDTFSNESKTREAWYTLHALLESNELIQQKGIVVIYHVPNPTPFNPSLIKLLSASIRGCIPVRVASFIVVRPPAIAKVVLPIVKVCLGKRLRQRIHVLTGANKRILEQLESFGLTSDKIPSELGGSVILNHLAWLNARRSME